MFTKAWKQNDTPKGKSCHLKTQTKKKKIDPCEIHVGFSIICSRTWISTWIHVICTVTNENKDTEVSVFADFSPPVQLPACPRHINLFCPMAVMITQSRLYQPLLQLSLSASWRQAAWILLVESFPEILFSNLLSYYIFLYKYLTQRVSLLDKVPRESLMAGKLLNILKYLFSNLDIKNLKLMFPI